jgi:hypothetical protein
MKAQDPRGGRIINKSLSAPTLRGPTRTPHTATKARHHGPHQSALSLDGRKHDIALQQIDISSAATE